MRRLRLGLCSRGVALFQPCVGSLKGRRWGVPAAAPSLVAFDDPRTSSSSRSWHAGQSVKYGRRHEMDLTIASLERWLGRSSSSNVPARFGDLLSSVLAKHADARRLRSTRTTSHCQGEGDSALARRQGGLLGKLTYNMSVRSLIDTKIGRAATCSSRRAHDGPIQLSRPFFPPQTRA